MAAAPASYRISSAGTALSALYAARGPSDNGSLRQVLVRRGGVAVDTLDVYDYLLNGNTAHDVRLNNSDLVFVPIHGPRVRIVGEVARPATYEMRPGETSLPTPCASREASLQRLLGVACRSSASYRRRRERRADAIGP